MAARDGNFATEYLSSLAGLLAKIDGGSVAQAISWMSQAEKDGRTVFTCGNGGSASIASQMVADMVKGASKASGRRFRMMALCDSVSTLTACANDIGYDSVFVEPLKVYGEPGDVLIAISGSGNSPNVLKAVEYANESGMRTIALTTSKGGRLKDIAQLSVTAPSDHMGRLEDSFFVITHVICYACMR